VTSSLGRMKSRVPPVSCGVGIVFLQLRLLMGLLLQLSLLLGLLCLRRRKI
jgi:hypothetical protein